MNISQRVFPPQCRGCESSTCSLASPVETFSHISSITSIHPLLYFIFPHYRNTFILSSLYNTIIFHLTKNTKKTLYFSWTFIHYKTGQKPALYLEWGIISLMLLSVKGLISNLKVHYALNYINFQIPTSSPLNFVVGSTTN